MVLQTCREKRDLLVPLSKWEGIGQRLLDVWKLTLQKPTEKWHQLHRSLLQGWPWNWGVGRVPRGLPVWLLGSLQASTRRHCSRWAAGSWTNHSWHGAAFCTTWQFGDMRYEQVKLYHWTVEEPGMMCWINAQRSRNLTPFPCHFPVPIRSSTLNQSICGFPAIYLLRRKSDLRSVSLKCAHSSPE